MISLNHFKKNNFDLDPKDIKPEHLEIIKELYNALYYSLQRHADCIDYSEEYDVKKIDLKVFVS